MEARLQRRRSTRKAGATATSRRPTPLPGIELIDQRVGLGNGSAGGIKSEARDWGGGFVIGQRGDDGGERKHLGLRLRDHRHIVAGVIGDIRLAGDRIHRHPIRIGPGGDSFSIVRHTVNHGHGIARVARKIAIVRHVDLVGDWVDCHVVGIGPGSNRDCIVGCAVNHRHSVAN